MLNSAMIAWMIRQQSGLLVCDDTVQRVTIESLDNDSIQLSDDVRCNGVASLLIRPPYPSYNIYEFIQIQGTLDNNSICINTVDGWIPELDEFSTWIQKSMPGGNKYLSDYNRQILAEIINRDNVAWIVSSSGSVIHAQRFEIKSRDGKLHFSMNSADPLFQMIQISNHVNLLIDPRQDEVDNIVVRCRVMEIREQDNYVDITLNPTNLAHSSASTLESITARKDGSVFEDLFDMLRSTTKYWSKIIRTPVIIASAVPVAMGSFIAYLDVSSFNLSLLVITFLSLIFAQVGINLILEYAKYRGSKSNLRVSQSPLSSTRFLHQGLTTPGWVLSTGLIFILLGLLLGLYLDTRMSYHFIIIVGMLGAFLAYSYGGPPFKLSQRGGGEIITLMIFGPLPTVASYAIQSGTTPETGVWLLGLIPGVLTSTLVLINNFDDVELDKIENKTTIVTWLGIERAWWLIHLFPLISVIMILTISTSLGLNPIYFMLVLPFLLDLLLLRILKSDMYLRIYILNVLLLVSMIGITIIDD